MKWGDTHDGYGEHFYDYNHVPKHQDYHEPSYKHEPVYKPEPYKPEPYKPVHH